MKHLLRLALLLCVASLLACHKTDSNTAGTSSIAGTWQLVETLADPGDGSGTWRAVTTADQTFITFTANGQIQGTAFPQVQAMNSSTMPILSSPMLTAPLSFILIALQMQRWYLAAAVALKPAAPNL